MRGIAIAVLGPIMHLRLLLWVPTQGDAFGLLHNIFGEGVGGAWMPVQKEKLQLLFLRAVFVFTVGSSQHKIVPHTRLLL